MSEIKGTDPRGWVGNIVDMSGDGKDLTNGEGFYVLRRDNDSYYGHTAKTKRPMSVGTKGMNVEGTVRPSSSGSSGKRNVPVKVYGAKQPAVSDPGWAQPEQQKQVTPSGKSAPTEGDKIVNKLGQMEEDSNNAQKGLAVANWFADITNANNAYRAAEGQAQLNIVQARNEAADAIMRGHQAQLDRQSEGYNAGQDATLAMVAQGQDARGGAVNKIRGSYEAMGYMNGAREMINAYREALGYELEEVAYEYQVDQAAINRDNQIFASTAKTVVTLGMM